MANELQHCPVEEFVNKCEQLIKNWSYEGKNSLDTAENCFEKNSAAYKTMHSIGSAYIFCAQDLKNVLIDLKFQTLPIPEKQTLQDLQNV